MIQVRENEAAVLNALKSAGGNSSFEELLSNSKQSDAAATRALTILEERQLVRVKEAEQIVLKLTSEGLEYAKQGLPERRVVQGYLSWEARRLWSRPPDAPTYRHPLRHLPWGGSKSPSGVR